MRNGLLSRERNCRPPGGVGGRRAWPPGKDLPVFGQGARGDLLVRVGIRIPEHTSRKERALHEQLRALGDPPAKKRKKWFGPRAGRQTPE